MLEPLENVDFKVARNCVDDSRRAAGKTSKYWSDGSTMDKIFFPVQRFSLRHAMTCIVLVLGMSSIATAQLPSTKLFSIFPAGGRVGSTVELTLTGGQELEDIDRLMFTHPGITATQKTQMVGGKTLPIANQFSVRISGEVPPGNYEVRTVGFFGVSNPRTFVVGIQPESLEAEPNNAKAQANATEMNQVINGRINGGTDVDWFKFSGKAGQRVLANCVARGLDSRLAATMELHDAAGKRLLLVRNTLVEKDALLDINLPADGDYFLKLYDFVFGGGEDYPYRLLLTTGPHIDFIVPPAGVPGTTNQYVVFGRNLPGGQPSGVTSKGRPLDQMKVTLSLPLQSD
ncbi:MAG: hypothetical protein FJ267_16960, partial [Planctomycetes bacterium]|nr:hypothetical protein [Planctomycetota bacterium]